jgi:hypothetical protein
MMPWLLPALAAVLLPPGALAQETARYRLELDLTWSPASHPHEFPPDAHFSDLIGVAHDARYVMFGDGLTASSGLELMAENGRASILEAELAEAARRRRVGPVFHVDGLATVPGRIAAEVELGPDHRLVSFTTMLAPSPDWFTGLAGIDLAPAGRWLERVELPLWAWDAGTDSGGTYTAPDADTQPRQSVRLLATPHMLGDGSLRRLGTARLTRIP